MTRLLPVKVRDRARAIDFWQDALLASGLFLLGLLPRLVNLRAFLTIDEPIWVRGAVQFALGLANGELSKTYWHFFPGITTTWGEVLILWVQYLIQGLPFGESFATFAVSQLSHPLDLIGSMRLSSVLITALGIPIVYLLLRPLVGKGLSLLGAGLVALDPFFLSHSRIVNADAVTSIFMLLSLLGFWHAWLGRGWRWVVFSGVMGGLAFLSKLPAPLVAGYLTILAVAWAVKEGRLALLVRFLLVWGGTAIVVVLLFWPALWVKPLETLRLMVTDSILIGEAGEGHRIMFRGMITKDPGWMFYPYIIAFRLTPLVLVGLLLCLSSVTTRLGWESPQRRATAMMLFGYAVFIVVVSSFGPKKQDRYVMAVFPALDLLAGMGLFYVYRLLAMKWEIASRLGWLFLGAGLLAQGWALPREVPYFSTYYNPLLGGLPRAVQETTVGWGEVLEQSANYLNQLPNAEDLRVAAWYDSIFAPYFVGQTLPLDGEREGDVLAADYVVFYLNQVQRQKPEPELIDFFRQDAPERIFRVHGVPYAWIYPGYNMSEVMRNPVVVDDIWLLGYHLWPETLVAGSKLTVTLYLRNRRESDSPPGQSINVRLLASDGTLWGDWFFSDSASDRWRRKSIAKVGGQLTLSENMPPGAYRLLVALWQTDTHQEVARFVMAEDQGWVQVRECENCPEH